MCPIRFAFPCRMQCVPIAIFPSGRYFSVSSFITSKGKYVFFERNILIHIYILICLVWPPLSYPHLLENITACCCYFLHIITRSLIARSLFQIHRENLFHHFMFVSYHCKNASKLHHHLNLLPQGIWLCIVASFVFRWISCRKIDRSLQTCAWTSPKNTNLDLLLLQVRESAKKIMFSEQPVSCIDGYIRQYWNTYRLESGKNKDIAYAESSGPTQLQIQKK